MSLIFNRHSKVIKRNVYGKITVMSHWPLKVGSSWQDESIIDWTVVWQYNITPSRRRNSVTYGLEARYNPWNGKMALCNVITTLWIDVIHLPTSRWRHQMETFSALLAICAGNSLVTGEFPSQRPVTRSFDIFFDLRLNKRLSKQSWGWWFETPSWSLWRHCNVNLAGVAPLPPDVTLSANERCTKPDNQN